MNWTFNDIPDLSGKTIIVTGGNSGIGFIAVREMAAKGGKITLASRDIERGEEARKKILARYPKANITVRQLDLSKLASVQNFAENFLKEHHQLDILLNNAGIMMPPYGVTKDGFESQMGINHLGHFALTGLLLERIKQTSGSRVVNISSSAHKMGRMDFDNLLFEEGKSYGPLKAYGRSKLANLLFTYELSRHFKRQAIQAIAVAAHPGVAVTNLGRFLEKRILVKLMMPVWNLMAQSADMGALPGIRAAVDPEVKTGEYYGPRKGSRGYPEIVSSNKLSYNEEDAQKLWAISEKLTGVVYTF